MSTFAMLDVLIGMIFIYLLLSFVCSAISEIIEGILKKRGSDLFRGIHELLHDDSENRILEKLYNHPLIYSLYKGNYNNKSKRNLPSYIPSGNFALAVMDLLLPATATNLSGAAGGGAIVTGVAAEEGTLSPDSNSPRALAPFRKAVMEWSESNAKQGLLALIDSAGDDISQVRQSIEAWYNSSMDRVAGWYKRRVQMILLCIGSVLACAINADTIALVKSLLNDPALRNSLIAASQEYAKSIPGDSTSAEQRIDNNLKQLQELRLPIGWEWKDAGHRSEQNNYKSNAYLARPSGVWGWIQKTTGWILTGLAISLGAPFWFDLLNKMMVIRSTVKPHEKSQEESSEDRQK